MLLFMDSKSAGVAYALVRAASRLISTHGSRTLKFVAPTDGRRDESRRGTHKCVRYACLILLAGALAAQTKPRARDLGVPFEGTPGALNSIVDVLRVEVGHTTLISGDGKLQVGAGPGRTGVNAILPRGQQSSHPVFRGRVFPNGNWEQTRNPR